MKRKISRITDKKTSMESNEKGFENRNDLIKKISEL